MALDQSALLGLLAQLKLTAVSDRISLTTENLNQELAAVDEFAPALDLSQRGSRIVEQFASRHT